MEDILLYTALVILSGIIGLITNYLAIRMLFHPYNEHKLFGKIRIPFTPGIIPRNRHRIAVSIAREMRRSVLSNEAIIEEINTKISSTDFIDDIASMKLNELIGSDSKEKISDRLANLIIDKITSRGYVSKFVDKLYDSIAPKLGFLAGMLGGLKDGFQEQLSSFLSKEGVSELAHILDDELERVMDEDVRGLLDKLSSNGNEIISNALSKLVGKYMRQVIDKIDLEALMVKKIDEMDIKEFEIMLLNVVRKELRAITYLGGLLGAILGLLNILSINIF